MSRSDGDERTTRRAKPDNPIGEPDTEEFLGLTALRRRGSHPDLPPVPPIDALTAASHPPEDPG